MRRQSRPRYDAEGGGPRFRGAREDTPPASPDMDPRAARDPASGVHEDGPRFLSSRFVAPAADYAVTRDPITEDDRELARRGWIDEPFYPTQRFIPAQAPVVWTFEPIQRVIRVIHRHYNYTSGVGASRFLRIPRIVHGSHERVRGSVAPQRMRPPRMLRLTSQPPVASYSEQTEVMG